MKNLFLLLSILCLTINSGATTIIGDQIQSSNRLYTVTLPQSTDTVLGRNTTDTVTNKSISGSTNTITNITSAAITDGTITSADISASANIPYSKTNLNNSIVSGDLTTGAVTSSKILDGAITSSDISTGGVTSTNILDGTITSGDISTGGVTSLNILDGTILTGDISTGGVTSTNILDGTIASGDISTGAITTTQILDGTITSADISSSGNIATSATTPLVLTSNTLSIPKATASVNGYLSSTDFTTFSASAPSSLTSGNIFVGNGSNVATSVTLSGDATMANTGVMTIGTGAITSGKILDGTIVSGDISASAGIPFSMLQNYASGGTILNMSLSASVASNALTISLKTAAGATPSASDPVTIGFRNTTAASGDITLVQATAATTLVISSGSTLGHINATIEPIYVAAINNGGTIELAASTTPFIYDESGTVTTTAEGGAGAADLAATVYSTTSRSSKAFRVLGVLKSTQSTAGTWTTVPTVVSTGSMSKASPPNVYSGSSTATRLCSFIVAAGTAATACTGTCTLYFDSGGCVSTVVRNSTGNYTVTWNTNFFSSQPVCAITVVDTAVDGVSATPSYTTTTSMVVRTLIDVTGVRDHAFGALCMGASHTLQ